MMGKGSLPYFYVRNVNFVALFKINELGEPIAIVNPTSSLAKAIKDSK